MKQLLPLSKMTAVILALSFLSTGCASRTIIKTEPEGARVFIDDIVRGTTPYAHRDKRLLHSMRRVRLQKDGYKTVETYIKKDEFRPGNCIGGLCVMPLLLWVKGYPPEYSFELEKSGTKSGVLNEKKGADLLKPEKP